MDLRRRLRRRTVHDVPNYHHFVCSTVTTDGFRVLPSTRLELICSRSRTTTRCVSGTFVLDAASANVRFLIASTHGLRFIDHVSSGCEQSFHAMHSHQLRACRQRRGSSDQSDRYWWYGSGVRFRNTTSELQVDTGVGH